MGAVMGHPTLYYILKAGEAKNVMDLHDIEFVKNSQNSKNRRRWRCGSASMLVLYAYPTTFNSSSFLGAGAAPYFTLD